jgi:hypothetical protein
MNLKIHHFKSQVALVICLLLALGCTDEKIEGASTTSVFTIASVRSSFSSLNGCLISGGSNGTNFIRTITYQGSGNITNVSYSYKFSSGATGTIASVYYYDSGVSSSFRGATSSGTLELEGCVRFGTNTSIEYTYTITASGKTYVVPVLLILINNTP